MMPLYILVVFLRRHVVMVPDQSAARSRSFRARIEGRGPSQWIYPKVNRLLTAYGFDVRPF